MPYIRKTDDLFISDKLRSVLTDIQDSSHVAKLLLRSRHPKEDLKEDCVNYLDISESDHTKISYLTQDRIQSIPEEFQVQDGGINYFSYNRRFMARPAAVINKIFKGIKDKDLEIFNNLYKSSLTRIKFNFRIVSGLDIKRFYNSNSYMSFGGSLGSSCMKYDNCQGYFKIYIDNPDVVSMLVMVNDEDELMGRALLWNFDSNKVMDRIYTVNDEELSFHFKKWAIDNGYLYKSEQKWNNTLSFESNGKTVSKKFSIDLKKWRYDSYPYLDTFKFFDKKNGVLYNYLDNENLRILCAPDGSHLDSDYLAFDFFTNLYQQRGETVVIKYKDGKMLENSDIRTHALNVYWSRINNMYILKSDSIYDEQLDDFLFDMTLDHLNSKEDILTARERKNKPSSKLEGVPSHHPYPRNISIDEPYFPLMEDLNFRVEPSQLSSEDTQEGSLEPHF